MVLSRERVAIQTAKRMNTLCKLYCAQQTTLNGFVDEKSIKKKN